MPSCRVPAQMQVLFTLWCLLFYLNCGMDVLSWMTDSRCVTNDEVYCYNPKLKVDRGTWKETVAYGRSSRRLAVWVFLSACCACLSVYHYRDAKYLAVPPSPSLWLRQVTTSRCPSHPSVPVPPLAIQNLPKYLAWKNGRKNPETTQIKVQRGKK